jgi:hypothetical protein
MQGVVPPFPDCNGDVVADPSRDAWNEKFHLGWLMRVLSINHKRERVSYSTLLLTDPIEQRPNSFQRIITGDASRFFLYYPRDSVWTTSRDEFSQRIKQKIDM